MPLITRPVLYSCNHRAKYLIQQRYRDGVHHVWCSQYFDARPHASAGVIAHVAASSNPAQILRSIMEDVHRVYDHHAYNIERQRMKLKDRALTWLRKEEITKMDYEEIVRMLDYSDKEYWRPVLYVIPVTTQLTEPPAGASEPRIKPVRPEERASLGGEFVIEDLASTEFDAITLEYADFSQAA